MRLEAWKIYVFCLNCAFLGASSHAAGRFGLLSNAKPEPKSDACRTAVSRKYLSFSKTPLEQLAATVIKIQQIQASIADAPYGQIDALEKKRASLEKIFETNLRIFFNREFQVDISLPELAQLFYDALVSKDGPQQNFIKAFAKLSVSDRQSAVDRIDNAVLAPAMRLRLNRGNAYYLGLPTDRIGERKFVMDAVVRQLPNCNNDILATLTSIEVAAGEVVHELRPNLIANWQKNRDNQLLLDPLTGVALSAEETPDPATFLAARAAFDLTENNQILHILPANERELARRLSAAYVVLYEKLYSGRYNILQQLRYNEPQYAGPGGHWLENRAFSIAEIVETRRYNLAPWWMNSRESGLTKTTNANTGGGFALYSPNSPPAVRDFFWPAGAGNKILLGDVRLNVTKLSADGTPLALELMVNVPNQGWEPFLFTNIGGMWVPRPKVTVRGQLRPVREFCLLCHTNSSGVPTPIPTSLKTVEEFEARGYKSQELIHFLMLHREEPRAPTSQLWFKK